MGFGLNVGGLDIGWKVGVDFQTVVLGRNPYLVGGHFKFIVGFGLSVGGAILLRR